MKKDHPACAHTPLEVLCAAPEPMSHAQLVAACGLSEITVAKRLWNLVDRGFATHAFLLDPTTCDRVILPGLWEPTPAGRDLVGGAR